jgi:hypothetical protein
MRKQTEVYGAFKEAVKKAESADFFYNFGIFTGINSECILLVSFPRDSVIGQSKSLEEKFLSSRLLVEIYA